MMMPWAATCKTYRHGQCSKAVSGTAAVWHACAASSMEIPLSLIFLRRAVRRTDSDPLVRHSQELESLACHHDADIVMQLQMNTGLSCLL